MLLNMEAKLQQAEELVAKPTSEEESIADFQNRFAKGLAILRQLCMSEILTGEQKLQALQVLYRVSSDEGQDMLCRWRDCIHFLKGDSLANMIKLLVSVISCSSISSHERTLTAVTLYNKCYLELCYDCFALLASDPEVLVDHRIESSRYLFMSDLHKEIAQNTLLEVTDTEAYPSAYRYKIIAGFISKTGIATTLNFNKLRIPYDEEFVYGLQTNFFYNDNNDVRDRILSGQHMIQMDCVNEDEKNDIFNILLQFASDKKLVHEVCADAADVVLREGSGENKKRAREIITELGFGAVDGHKFGGSLLDRSRTIYTDAENIHEFTEQVNRFIEKIITETDVKVRDYSEVHNEVTELVKEYANDNSEKFQAFKALNRISVDTARFTNYRVTLAEIFVHTWLRIEQYPEEQRIPLEKRLIEELIDMGDTCSSGHSGRFVNVLSTVDETLRISWSDQINANIIGRMNAQLRDCPDEELRASLAMANSEMAEDIDKENYAKYIKEQIPLLHDELFGEFVGEGYISATEFEKAFENSAGVHWGDIQ